MRADVDKIEFGEYKFILEFDAGADPEYPYTLWIYYSDGKLVSYINKLDVQVRRDFPKNYSRIHLINYCKKFAFDNEYRNKCMIWEH